MLFDSFEAYDVQAIRTESRNAGKIEGKIESIIDLLNNLGELPNDLKAIIQKKTDLDVVNDLFMLAMKSTSIDDFRQRANI